MSSVPPSDQQLIDRVRNGQTEAFAQLILRYQNQVFRIHFQFTQDHQIAEDLTQECFVRAYRKLDSFDASKGALSTWLFTIARNLARNALSKRSHEGSSLGSVAEPSHEDSPQKLTSRRETAQRLDLALAALPEPFQSAFILAELEELPIRQVAEIEGVPVGTIKSRVSRAKAKLREALQSPLSDHEA